MYSRREQEIVKISQYDLLYLHKEKGLHIGYQRALIAQGFTHECRPSKAYTKTHKYLIKYQYKFLEYEFDPNSMSF